MPKVNLIPPEWLHRRIQRRRLRYWSVATLVVWVAALVPFGIEIRAKFQLSSQRTAVSDASQQLESAKKDAEKSKQQLATLRQEITRAEKLRFKRHWTSLWYAVTQALPHNVWLTVFSTEPAKPQVGTGVMSPVLSSLSKSGETPTDKVPSAVSVAFHELIGKSGPQGLVLEGQAMGLEEIYVFVKNLNQLGLFNNASLNSVTAGEVEGSKVTNFKIYCEW